MTYIENEHCLGETIARLRKDKGWTQVVLAEKLNVSDKAVSKWESDNGFPDIKTLPRLAELLGVSIDYLLTGKEPDKQIVISSKAEQCAKTDNPELLDEIDILTKDENGKTIIDYAKEYQSKAVIREIINKHGFVSFMPELVSLYHYSSFNDVFAEALYYSLWTNTTSKLESSFVTIMKNNGENNHVFFRQREIEKKAKVYFWKTLTSLDHKCFVNDFIKKAFELLVTNPTIYEEILVDWFTVNKDRGDRMYTEYIWREGLSFLLETALMKDCKELFDKYFDYISELNKESSAHIDYCKKNNCMNISTRNEYPFVPIRIETIEWLLKMGNLSLAETLHCFNKRFGLPSIDDDVLRLEKLKSDKSTSKKELMIQSAIHNGILIVDEILASDDISIISEALERYPIHFVETLIKWFDQKQWRSLFEYAVDENATSLANSVIKQDLVGVEKWILDYWHSFSSCTKVNEKQLFVYRGRPCTLLARNSASGLRIFETRKLDDITALIKECKTRIINDYTLKTRLENTVRDLTKEYFISELNKGNYEMVIIKLCVRLEETLRCVYRLSGDFSEMLDSYCREFNTTDDESNDYDPDTPKKLQKLRVVRNGCVHPDGSGMTLTREEFQWYINYICGLK